MVHNHLCPGCFSDKGSQNPCPYCGYVERDLETPLYLPPRTILAEKYIIGKILGQGGFGITYLGWDLNLNIKLAIKEFFPQGLVTRLPGQSKLVSFTDAEDQNFDYWLERFLMEARTLAQFEQHPNIVSVRDFFKANNTAYMIMSYVEGMTLDQYLNQAGGKLPYDKAIEVMMPVMDALREVHEVGVMHRDISPDNIFIDSKGRVVLIDFGAARQAMGEKSKSLSVILKAGYAPEEQYRSKGKQGPWTDIYAVGATLYHAITGEAPPEAMDRLDEDDLSAPSELGVEIDPGLERALLKALAVKAGERFQTVAAFQRELVAASGKGPAGESTVGAEPEEPAEPVRAEIEGGEEGLKEKAQKGVQAVVVKEPEKKSEPAENPAGWAQKDAVWNKISKRTVKTAALVFLCGLLIFGVVSLFGGEDGFGLTWQRTYTYEDGSEYIGQLKKGLPHGEGTRTWADGNKYVGEFKDGQLHGQGTFAFISDREYVGELKADLFDGQGTMIRPDGTEYGGELKGDLFRGQGTIIWADGDKYVGEFKDGLEHGQGTYTYANGDKYVGEFKDGQRHGQGTITWAGGDKYVGKFKDGLEHGQGTYTWADGEKHEGEFKDGKAHGQGTRTWADGDKYVGEFKDGKAHGQGTYTFADGDKYVGEFKDDQPHGQGTYTWANGDKYVGEQKDGKAHGQGTYTFADGTVWKGRWEDDEFLGP